MAGVFTRAQVAENLRFLELLGETGNSRLAAREIGRPYSSMQHRRKVNAGFAQRWEAAVAAAHARFHLAGGKRGTACLQGEGADFASFSNDSSRSGLRSQGLKEAARRKANPLRTTGRETVVVRTRSGKLQVRFAHPGKLTKAAAQAFLAALSATANIRLSAAAAGASPAAFYRLKLRDPAFAREMRIALETGYDRLKWDVMAAAAPESWEDDGWRHARQPVAPPVSFGQALHLLALHRNTAELGWERPYRRKIRGESWDEYRARQDAFASVERRRRSEDEAIDRALRYEKEGAWRRAGEEPLPNLPPLHLVTGWSRASGRPPHKEGGLPFGGWGIEDMRRKMRER